MNLLDLVDVVFSVLAIGMSVYALLEVGTYLDQIEDFARRFSAYERHVSDQLTTLRNKVDRLLKKDL